LTPIDELLLQAAIEIRHGEMELGAARSLAGNRKSGAEREYVRELEAEVDFLKRTYSAYRIKGEAFVKAVELPVVDDGPMKTAAERMRAVVARGAREEALA